MRAIQSSTEIATFPILFRMSDSLIHFPAAPKSKARPAAARAPRLAGIRANMYPSAAKAETMTVLRRVSVILSPTR
jgi:hypothetical protein